VRIAVLSTMLLRASATLTAQTMSPPSPAGSRTLAPAQAAAELQPPAVEKKGSFEEKWLSFGNKAISAKWGWMLMLDGLAMTQDSVNEEQVGPVPAKGEPRADRLYVGGEIKFRKPWAYFVGANYNGLERVRMHWAPHRSDGRTSRQRERRPRSPPGAPCGPPRSRKIIRHELRHVGSPLT